jgi:hypothetical protein
MLNKAIEKIRSEMELNKNNPYVQVVGEFLLQELEVNPASAERILAEGKTVAKSLDEMRKEAEKKKVGNCAVLTDKEGFAIVLKYFGIDSSAAVNSEAPKASPVTIPKPGADPVTIPKPDAAPVKKAVDFDVKLEDLL